MKRILFCIALLLTSIFAAGQDYAEKLIIDLSKRKFDWLITNQYDSLEKYLDERIQYVHSNGWVQNKMEVLNDMRSGKLIYKKVIVKEATVRVYEQAAIINGLGTFEGVMSGTPFSIDLRYTEVFVKSANRWALASRHANRMP